MPWNIAPREEKSNSRRQVASCMHGRLEHSRQIVFRKWPRAEFGDPVLWERPFYQSGDVIGRVAQGAETAGKAEVLDIA